MVPVGSAGPAPVKTVAVSVTGVPTVVRMMPAIPVVVPARCTLALTVMTTGAYWIEPEYVSWTGTAAPAESGTTEHCPDADAVPAEISVAVQTFAPIRTATVPIGGDVGALNVALGLIETTTDTTPVLP